MMTVAEWTLFAARSPLFNARYLWRGLYPIDVVGVSYPPRSLMVRLTRDVDVDGVMLRAGGVFNVPTNEARAMIMDDVAVRVTMMDLYHANQAAVPRYAALYQLQRIANDIRTNNRAVAI